MSFCDGDEFLLMLLSLVRDHGTWWSALLLETFVKQFALTFAIAFNAFSYRVKYI